MTAAALRSPSPIIMADDDPDDQALTRQALGKTEWRSQLTMVANGQDLLDLLRRKGRYSDSIVQRPALILLDLNMPRKNGFEALKEIREDKDLKDLPVVVLSTSSTDEDVEKSYSLGCNSYLSKPASFEGMTKLMEELVKYWFETSEIPGSKGQ